MANDDVAAVVTIAIDDLAAKIKELKSGGDRPKLQDFKVTYEGANAEEVYDLSGVQFENVEFVGKLIVEGMAISSDLRNYKINFSGSSFNNCVFSGFQNFYRCISDKVTFLKCSFDIVILSARAETKTFEFKLCSFKRALYLWGNGWDKLRFNDCLAHERCRIGFLESGDNLLRDGKVIMAQDVTCSTVRDFKRLIRIVPALLSRALSSADKKTSDNVKKNFISAKLRLLEQPMSISCIKQILLDCISVLAHKKNPKDLFMANALSAAQKDFISVVEG